MMDWLATLIPAELGALATAVLLLGAIVTSFVTASFGAGGGVLLLALMTLFMPVATVIPLHGVIQAGSNVGRVALMWRHIQWPILLAFAIGAVVGAAAGSRLLVGLPQAAMELALGAFILWSCWGPMPQLPHGSNARLGLGGAVTSALTLFVGATGPFVAAFLRGMRLNRLHHVGTFSACMVTQHGLKILVFALLGFGFAPYVPFLVAMFVFGFLGTWLGRLVLERMDDQLFRRMLAVVLTLIALRLLYSGGRELMGG